MPLLYEKRKVLTGRQFSMSDQVASVRKPNERSNPKVTFKNNNSSVNAASNIRPSTAYEPDLLWNEYKNEHMDHQDYTNDHDRRFAVVIYRCPERAGNFLNNLFNSVAWAIAHNRTILYDYQPGGPLVEHMNRKELCDKVLRPTLGWKQYKEYRSFLPNVRSVTGQEDHSREKVVIYPQIQDVNHSNTELHRASWSAGPIEMVQKGNASIDPSVRERLNRLYARGPKYWRGMLFRNLFEFHARLPADNHLDSFSIAVHSRHIVPADGGEFVASEIKCLESVLSHRDKPCVVYIISDRSATRRLLSEWAASQQCSIVTQTIPSTGVGQREEHGPYAGLGFLEDLQSASRARNGLVGCPARSSFVLLQSLVEYDRASNNNSIQHMETCWTRQTDPRGFRYEEPESPWFVSDQFLDPIPPTDILNIQKERLKQNRASRDTVVLRWDGCLSSVWTLAQGYMCAVLSNRSAIIHHVHSAECVPLPWHVHTWIPRYEHSLSSKVRGDFIGPALQPAPGIVDIMRQLRLPAWLEHKEEFVLGAIFHHILGAPLSSRELQRDVPYGQPTLSIFLAQSDKVTAQKALSCVDSMTTPADTCQVFLMIGDSNADILSWMEEKLASMRCSLKSSTIVSAESDILHGIYSLSRSRRGYVGPTREASDVTRLILSKLHFARQTDAFFRGRMPPEVPQFHTCFVP